MRVIIQRVKRAALSAEIEAAETGVKEMQLISNINNGVVCLLGIHKDDTWEDALYIIKKCLNLKLWSRDDKKWNKSVMDLNYELLVVSQFTLYANVKKGNKPDFHLSKQGNEALILYNAIIEQMKNDYKPEKIKTGKFGHYMNIDMVSDGPATICVDTTEKMSMIKKVACNNKKEL